MSAPLSSPGRRDNWVELLAREPGRAAYTGDGLRRARGHDAAARRAPCSRVPTDSPTTAGCRPVDIAPSWPVGTLELAHNELFDTDELHGRRGVVAASQGLVRRRPDARASGAELLQQEVPGVRRRRATSRSGCTPTVGRHPGADHRRPPRRHAARRDRAVPAVRLRRLRGVLRAGVRRGTDRAARPGRRLRTAEIRGGGEGGRRWWLDGQLEHKQNTFSDQIAAADFLADGLVDGTRIVTRGLSAGGLLQGAVFSQAPQRWAGVIAEVPAVDILTTMLDPSIPLTINEWDEWGDPRKPDEYQLAARLLAVRQPPGRRRPPRPARDRSPARPAGDGVGAGEVGCRPA